MLPRNSTRTMRPSRKGGYQAAGGAGRVPADPRGFTTSSRRAGSAGRASGSSPSHDFGTLPTRRYSEGSDPRGSPDSNDRKEGYVGLELEHRGDGRCSSSLGAGA